jgi:hypothetical protein
VLGLPVFVQVQHVEGADRIAINGGAGNDWTGGNSPAASAT